MRQHVSSCRGSVPTSKSQRWIWMSSRGSGWTAALWPHPETHGAHHRHIARNGVHRRPETVGKCCVSSSDRPASPPSAIASQPHAHDCITTGRPANPPHLRSLSHGHPWCSFASWGWCLAVVLSRTPIFASGAQHPPLTLVPRGGRAGLLRIPGRSVLLSGAHTTTLGV